MGSWDFVGIIRAITGNWEPYLEGALPSTELEPMMERSSIPSFGFFFMLGLSATIAALGLIANSAPAIIGAMIIAPLMGPIISLAYGLVSFQWRMISRSFLTISTGAIVVIIFAYAASALFGLRIAGSEIISRASPTLLDLGPLGSQALGVESTGHRHPLGMVRDRDIFEAAPLGRVDHLLQGGFAVGRRSMQVQVAADIGQLYEFW